MPSKQLCNCFSQRPNWSYFVVHTSKRNSAKHKQSTRALFVSMPSSRDVRLAACAPLWLLACTLGPVSADVTMLSETFDSAAAFTAPAAPPLFPPPMPPAIPPTPPSPPPARPPTPSGFQTWSVASGSNCAQELKPSGFIRVSPSKLTLGRAIDWPGRGSGSGGGSGGGGGGRSSSATSSLSTSLVGIFFPSIGLNRTSSISHTHLVFDIADVEDFSSEALTLRIYGEKSADVLQPTSANADLSSRPRTTACVIWQNVEVSTQKHTLLHSPVPAAMC